MNTYKLLSADCRAQGRVFKPGDEVDAVVCLEPHDEFLALCVAGSRMCYNPAVIAPVLVGPGPSPSLGPSPFTSPYSSPLILGKPEPLGPFLRARFTPLELVRASGWHLRWFAHDEQTPELASAAAAASANTGSRHICYDVLAYMNPALQTARIALEAVSAFGLSLANVRPDLRTRTVCLAAVRSMGMALAHVPTNRRSREIEMAAVVAAGDALQYVSAEHQTPALCRLALADDFVGIASYASRNALRYMARQTEELCMLAMARGYSLRDVRPACQTPAVITAAIATDIRNAVFIRRRDMYDLVRGLLVNMDQPAVADIPPHVAAVYLRDAETNGIVCPITHEPVVASKATLTRCGHVFDSAGLATWFETSRVCPTCRCAL